MTISTYNAKRTQAKTETSDAIIEELHYLFHLELRASIIQRVRIF